ncbi:MAG: c-type cytochrome domain-containing protein [Saprospiraceae bacterium]
MKNILFALVIVTANVSCTNETAFTDEVCFQQEVLPLINGSCAYSGCHNPVERISGYDFTNYEGILKAVTPGKYGSSKLYTSLISTTTMPPPPDDKFTRDKLELIATWIQQGAKNSTCSTNICDTSDVTLSGSVRPILQNYCGSCHLVNNPQGNVDFRTYDDLKIYVDQGSLIGSIKFESPWSRMPKNSNKIPSCDIQIIQIWLDHGALNN